MDKRVTSTLLVLTVIAVASCGGGSSSSSPGISISSAKYLYVANSDDGTISAFAISPSGELTPVRGANAVTSLVKPTGLAVGSSGKVYVGSSVSREISTLSADLKTGQLSSPTILPSILLNSPSGSNAANLVSCGAHLFAFGEGTGPVQGGGSRSTGWSGSVFSLNSDGSIDPNQSSGFGTFDSLPIVSNGFVDPTCSYVFHANTAANTAVQTTVNTAAHSVIVYDGSAAGTAPVWVAADANLKFLYVSNSGSNDVSAFVINVTSGKLTAVGSSPFSAGKQPSAVIVVQNWVYVANSGDNTVSGFSLDQVSGALTPIAGSPFQVGDMPIGFATTTTDQSHSPTGRLLYVANHDSNNVSAFVIDNNGVLRPTAGSPFAVGSGPKAIAVLVGPQ